MTPKDWLTSKTFWSAAGLAGLAVAQAVVLNDYPAAVQSALGALAVLGLRHAIATNNPTGGGA